MELFFFYFSFKDAKGWEDARIASSMGNIIYIYIYIYIYSVCVCVCVCVCECVCIHI